MESGAVDDIARRMRGIARLLGTLCLSACQALPGTPDAAKPQPVESAALRELRSEHAACETRLAAALASREEVGVLLTAQDARLSQMQASLRRVESRLDEQSRGSIEPAPARTCEPEAVQLPRKLTVGRREKVWIEPLQMLLPARIDTGAETASLDARNIEEFERNGNAWVRFDIVHPETGEAISMESEIVRFVRILQSSADKPERRAVIELGIVIGTIRQEAEFTLSNRSHLDFQVLVGRNILRDLMIVDVGQSNIALPKLHRERDKKAADAP